MSAPTVDREDVQVVVDRSIGAPRRRRRRRIIAIVLAVLLVVAAVWAVWFSSLLSVRSVRAVGVEGPRADAVLAVAAVPAGVPLARVDAGRAERAVLALDWVADAEVRRGWPSEVVVAVTPRVPVAILDSTSTTAAVGSPARRGVDAEGAVFEVTAAEAKGLPRVDAEGAALTETMAVLATLPPDLARRVVSASATTRDDVDLTLRSGDVVRWGSADQAAFKAEVLRALMNRKAEVYDVSAPELPTTFRPRS